MQLLPGQNFLLERGFFSLNICNFHRKNGINCFIWLGTYSESQIHGFVGVWRNLWRHLAQLHCQHRLTYKRTHRIMSRWDYVQKESPQPLWAAVPVPSPPHSTEVFPYVQMELSVSQVVLLPLILSHWRWSGCPFLRYLCVLMRSLLSCLLSRTNSPSSLSHSSWERCCSHFSICAGSLGCREGQIPVPVQQCLAPIRFPGTCSWRGTFRVVLSETGVKKPHPFQKSWKFHSVRGTPKWIWLSFPN